MGKYLKFYKEYLKTGKLPSMGLCNCFREDEKLKLFAPPKEHFRKFYINCPISGGFWGYNGKPETSEGTDISDYIKSGYEFTPLRQTIVLFMAAMNNEL